MGTLLDPTSHVAPASDGRPGRATTHAIATDWLIFAASKAWSVATLLSQISTPRVRPPRGDVRPWLCDHPDLSVQTLARIAVRLEIELATLHARSGHAGEEAVGPAFDDYPF